MHGLVCSAQLLWNALKVKLEIKLPSRAAFWHVAILVTQSNTQLDQPQKINITPQSLILVVRMRGKGTHWARNDSWKLSVLRRRSKRPDAGSSGPVATIFTTRTIATQLYVGKRSRIRDISSSTFDAQTSLISMVFPFQSKRFGPPLATGVAVLLPLPRGRSLDVLISEGCDVLGPGIVQPTTDFIFRTPLRIQ